MPLEGMDGVAKERARRHLHNGFWPRFSKWEERCRGWKVYNYLTTLEPRFQPLAIDGTIDRFSGRVTWAEPTDEESKEVDPPFVFWESDQLAEFLIVVPVSQEVQKEAA